MKNEELYTPEEIALLSCCTLCPRECRVDRFDGGTGYCGMDAGLSIASICIHRGEEPPISGPDGICNIFFAGCNLRCIYCQNHDISRPDSACIKSNASPEAIISQIGKILDMGIKSVGFVSPSHVVPQVKAIIRGLNSNGHKPVTVYNTNSYDKPEIIESLEDMIDVYLPDYKYVTSGLSGEFSDSHNYPETALEALKKMYWHKGSTLQLDDNGRAEKGILIRHLVLPGHVEESIRVLRSISEELSTGMHISLMSQYHPTHYVRNHPVINRPLYRSEYEMVAREMERLGFRNGWLQEIGSNLNFRPDFSRDNPFEQG